MSKLLRTALAALAAVVAFVALGAAPSLAQEEPPTEVNSWALSPGDGSQEAGERPYLSYELAPGADVEDVVTLSNYSNVPLTFQLYATDAFNNEDGSFNLLAGNEAPSDVGTWVALPMPSIYLEPLQQASLPITIHVPIDARPGDHVGAILASSVAPGTGPDGKIVNIDRRTGTRVYVRVDGPLQPELAVEDLTTAYGPRLNPLDGEAEVRYRVVNRGNVRLSGTHQLRVAGPFGLFETSLPVEDLPEILPGESVEITRTVLGVAATGLAFASVDLTPTDVVDSGEEVVVRDGRAFGLAVPFTLVALFLIAVLAWFSRRAYLRHRIDEGGDDRRDRSGTDRRLESVGR